MSRPSKVVLLTGLPDGFLAVRVLRHWLERDPDLEIRCVVPPEQQRAAASLFSTLDATERVRVYVGNEWAMDLGLSGAEWTELTNDVTHIHHTGVRTQLGTDREDAVRANVDATRELIELATHAKRLEQLVFWSSATISGTRRGYVLEEELSLEAPPRNAVEESLRTAEGMLRRMQGRLPITVLRPSLVVGDSKTGEIDRLEGPYRLILWMLTAPADLTIPMPVPSDIPLHLVPIDYVVEAGLRIALDPRSRGRTHHVVDPDPLTIRRVFELVAQETGRKLPKPMLPTVLAERLLRLPGVSKVAPLPKSFVEQLATEVVYDDHAARAILDGTGITCPAFESYVGAMVEHVRDRLGRSDELERPVPDTAPSSS